MSAFTETKPTIWLTVRSITPAPAIGPPTSSNSVLGAPFVLQVTSRYRSSFTPTIRPNISGLIDIPLTFAVRPSENPALILHPVAHQMRRSSTLVDQICPSPPSSPLSPSSTPSNHHGISPPESPISPSSPCLPSPSQVSPLTLRPPLPLKLDFCDLLESLQSQTSQQDSTPCTLTATARAPDSTLVTFQASLQDPTLSRDAPSDDLSVHTFMDDFVPTSMPGKRPVDASFSSVSDDGVDFPPSPSHSGPAKNALLKTRQNNVKFDSQLYHIPTMENLHRQVLASQSDTSHLWLGVSDLNEQIRRLRLQVRTLQATLDSQPHHQSTLTSPLIQSPRPPRTTSPCSQATTKKLSRRRRRVVLDGDALAHSFADARSHATDASHQFDSRGITAAIDYYAARGRRAVAVVCGDTWNTLRSRVKHDKKDMQHVSRLEDLKRRRMLYTCPASCPRKRDFLLQFALDHDAEVVANLWAQDQPQSAKDVPQDVVTTFMFIDDQFVPQQSHTLDRSKVSESETRSTIRRCSTW